MQTTERGLKQLPAVVISMSRVAQVLFSLFCDTETEIAVMTNLCSQERKKERATSVFVLIADKREVLELPTSRGTGLSGVPP